MNVVRDALALYKEDEKQFFQDACAILGLIEGRIIIAKDLMLWGFPVHVGDTVPEHIPIADYADPDAWMVWLAVGTLSLDAVVQAMPYPLPKVIFARDNRLRCYNLDTLKRHLPR
jgi:hypothetical protein